jgi:putative FmdB family regulatory protein
MPLYEYQCESCAERFELIQKFSDPPPETCPKCGKGPVQRLLSSPAIQFKGTGWYITDYAKKGTSAAAPAKGADSKSSDGSAGESKGDTAASPSPSAPASDTKK